MGGQHLTRDQIRGVACPTCKAVPGAKCTHTGPRAAKRERQGINHEARMHKAQEELIDRAPPTEPRVRVRQPNHYAQQAADKPLPICPTCGQQAHEQETRYGLRCSCCGLWSWDRHPLVDKATHEARSAAHAAFDPFWKEAKARGYAGVSRSSAYKWLADELGVEVEQCHMKLMDRALAERVPAAVEAMEARAKEIPF